MAVTALVLWVPAGLLVVTGVAKVVRPGPTREALRGAGLRVPAPVVRIGGLGEAAVGALAVGTGARPAAVLVAAAYLAFTWFSLQAIAHRDPAPCGCMGTDGPPIGPGHVALDLAGVGLAAVAAAWPPGPLPEAIDGVVVAVLGGVGALVAVAVAAAWLAGTRQRVAPTTELAATTLTGRSPKGRRRRVTWSASERVVVLALSSTCVTCRTWWDALAADEVAAQVGTARVLVVTRSPGAEDPDRIGELAAGASTGTEVLMSDEAWHHLDIGGAPEVVALEGAEVAFRLVGYTFDEATGRLVDPAGATS